MNQIGSNYKRVKDNPTIELHMDSRVMSPNLRLYKQTLVTSQHLSPGDTPQHSLGVSQTARMSPFPGLWSWDPGVLEGGPLIF